jgi:hypothetical protein
MVMTESNGKSEQGLLCKEKFPNSSNNANTPGIATLPILLSDIVENSVGCLHHQYLVRLSQLEKANSLS